MVRPAPASLAAARLSEPDLPAPPMTATTGPGCVTAYCATIRLVIAGAPQTSITARLSSLGRSSGMTAAIERPNSTAYPSAGTCSDCPVPARQAVLDDERSQGQGDEGGDVVADLQAERATPGRPPRPCRRACRRSRSRGSASCRGRRRCRAPRGGRRRPVASPCLPSSWRNDAASRLRRSTRMRTSSGHSSLRVSSRWAAWGRTPCPSLASSRTRCNPVGSLARTGRLLHEFGGWQDMFRRGFGQTGDPPPTVAQ